MKLFTKQKKSKKSIVIFICISLFLLIIAALIVMLVINNNKPSKAILPKQKTEQVVKQKPVEKKAESVVEPKVEESPAATQPVVQTPPPTVSTGSPTTDTSSIRVVVNKQHALSPIDYIPGDLVTTHGATISAKAQADFEALLSSAATAGIYPNIQSSYRSYSSQNSIYNNYVANYGQAATDTFSARPGHSEHQTGLAIDFGSSTNSGCNFDECYASTVEGSWLAAHATEFGFLLRYTTANQNIAGYKAEPWHYRYIGKDLAADMKNKSISTLEEYFGISGGTSY